MSNHRCGKQSFIFDEMPVIKCWSSIAGKKESEGPLGKHFDITSKDTYFGQKSWEEAERHMQEMALKKLIEKGNIRTHEIGVVFSGDLLNQCIGSSFTLRNEKIPHLG